MDLKFRYVQPIKTRSGPVRSMQAAHPSRPTLFSISMRFSDRKKTLSDSTPKPNADCSFRRRLPTFPSDINRHLRSKASTKQQSKVSITDLIFSHSRRSCRAENSLPAWKPAKKRILFFLTVHPEMNKLLDDENEEDETFWNQEALKEHLSYRLVRRTSSGIYMEENDENYEEEGEVVDVFDSDFDDDEPQPDEEVENEADDRMRTKKRLIFPGKQLPKKKTKKKVLSNLGKAPQDDETAEQSTLPEHHDAPDDVEVERIVRKSTRTSVIVRQAERDAIRAALQATMKPIKRKKEGEEKRMTQEEMLLEAAQTEIMNLRNLERVLAREEEVKKRAVVHKAVYSGPQIRYLSRDGNSYLEFSKGLLFQSEISTVSTPYPQKAVCAVTGLPANNIITEVYGSILMGSPLTVFQSLHVFPTLLWVPDLGTVIQRLGYLLQLKKLLEPFVNGFLEENRNAREKKSLGFLSEEISGQGFSERRKRSVIPNRRETSDFRYSARFLQIPALESQVSE
ncbi:unnamed protein product [Camellia sinensis]